MPFALVAILTVPPQLHDTANTFRLHGNGVLLQFVKLQCLPKDFCLGVDGFMTELSWSRGLLVINALKV